MPPIRTDFMLLQSTRHWRELGPEDQRAALDAALALVWNGHPGVRMTHYAVAWPGERCTDLVAWEVEDEAEYQGAVAALRRDPFLGAPLFEVVEVIAALADNA